MSEEMIYIRCSVSTNLVGSECVDVYEYPKEDWDKLSDEEKTSLLDEFFDDHRGNYMDNWRQAEDSEGNVIHE